MPRTVMVYSQPIVRVAATEEALATGDAFECQVTSAIISTNVTFNTIPSTGCAGATQSPAAPGYQLDIAWLQDWKSPGGGLSGWAWANKLKAMWVEIVPDKDDDTVAARGPVYVSPGQFGGTFGDGSAAISNATWPYVDEPEIDMPTTTVAAAESSELRYVSADDVDVEPDELVDEPAGV